MVHYRSMYEDNGMLYACHLNGKDVTLTIKRVTAGAITGAKGKSDKKPIVEFEKTDKKLGLNKTNGRTIATLYGPDVEKWAGKRITVYATTTEFGREQVECIRVRPMIPNATVGKRSSPNNLSGDDATEMMEKRTGKSRPPQPHEEPETQLLVDDIADSQASEPTGEAE